jgi:hypothetical protein
VKNIRTRFLVILLIVATLTAAMAMAHLSSAKRQAEDSARDLSITRQYLADIRASRGTSSQPIESGDVNLLLRQAAAATAASGKLTSIEPGQPARIEGTDYQETPIFLRLEAMPMKQLVSFLYESSARDAKARCRSIELSAAAPSSNDWSADVTIGYLSYSPRAGESK